MGAINNQLSCTCPRSCLSLERPCPAENACPSPRENYIWTCNVTEMWFRSCYWRFAAGCDPKGAVWGLSISRVIKEPSRTHLSVRWGRNKVRENCRSLGVPLCFRALLKEAIAVFFLFQVVELALLYLKGKNWNRGVGWWTDRLLLKLFQLFPVFPNKMLQRVLMLIKRMNTTQKLEGMMDYKRLFSTETCFVFFFNLCEGLPSRFGLVKEPKINMLGTERISTNLREPLQWCFFQC